MTLNFSCSSILREIEHIVFDPHLSPTQKSRSLDPGMSSLLHLASHDSHEIGLLSRYLSFIPSLSQRGMMMISGGRKVGISEHSQTFIYQIPSLFDLKFLTFVTVGGPCTKA